MAKTVRKRKSARKAMKTKNFAVFSLHAKHPAKQKMLARLRKERRANVPAFALDTTQPAALDSETAAKLMLNQILDHADWLPDLVRPKVGEDESDFRSLGTEFVPLTGTKTVKFRQYIRGIPVYGTLITIELDERRECLALNATVATPVIESHIAKISPLDALTVAAKKAGYGRERPDEVPQLNFYLARNGKWHLAYMIHDVRTQKPPTRQPGGRRHTPLVFDYVVSASNGKLLAELPRTPSLTRVSATAEDSFNRMRRFHIEPGSKRRLRDPVLNVETYDFKFRDPRVQRDELPGKLFAGNFPPAAVSAHVNSSAVAAYLRKVLKRNNIDNKGGCIRSVVNCVVKDSSEGKRVWDNGFWDGGQMVYGQAKYGDGLRSLAASPDVVAHELFHGVISHTARLEYVYMAGALNESYADIFGILISNARKRNIKDWNWEIGDGLSDSGEAIRDFRDPARYGNPGHMDDYLKTDDDKGGVHTNSSIHNYAAYKIMSAKTRPNGPYLFKPHELAAIFYIALTQYLPRQATFWASRVAVVLAARSYFRKLPPAALAKRVAAIKRGFAAAGIERT